MSCLGQLQSGLFRGSPREELGLFGFFFALLQTVEVQSIIGWAAKEVDVSNVEGFCCCLDLK